MTVRNVARKTLISLYADGLSEPTWIGQRTTKVDSQSSPVLVRSRHTRPLGSFSS